MYSTPNASSTSIGAYVQLVLVLQVLVVEMWQRGNLAMLQRVRHWLLYFPQQSKTTTLSVSSLSSLFVQ
jgi:hypothetical protein